MSNYCVTSNGIRFAYLTLGSLRIISVERRGGSSEKTALGGRWFTTTKGANVDVLRVSCCSTVADTLGGKS
jgi:hypothetical protein